MNTCFHLPSCSTCQRIIKELELDRHCTLRDIRTMPVSEAELDRMAELAGSYEALFSRRARQYKIMGLGDRQLEEQDYRALILREDTFLKRPVVLLGNHIFIGNSSKTVQALRDHVPD